MIAETYNTSGVPVDYQDRMAYKMNLGDKIVQSERAVERAVVIDRVLEIINKLYDTTCDRYSKVGYMESARNELRMCRQAVLTLKGEQA